MKIISGYLSKTIIGSVLVITLVLMGIEMLVTFIGELGNIGVGNYGVWQALRFVILDMPYQINLLFPMAGLVGSLIGLGVLASQSELIVMRAAGYSIGQICADVLKAAFVMVIIAMIFGEVVAPYSENMANVGRTLAKSGSQALTTNHGVWIRENNDFIHINKVLTKHNIEGITDYHFNQDHSLQYLMSSHLANYQQQHWILHGVKQTNLASKNTSTYQTKTEIWPLNFNPSVLSVADTDPRNMSMIKLYDYIQYLKSNGLRSASYQLSFWKRIFQPFATAVMIFLAVPFVFGPLRTVTMGLRVLSGVTVGFLFYILNQFFGPISSLYQMPPILGALLPTLVFIFAGFFLVARMK